VTSPSPEVNFTNVLQAAFTCADPKIAKRRCLLLLLGSLQVKAACKHVTCWWNRPQGLITPTHWCKVQMHRCLMFVVWLYKLYQHKYILQFLTEHTTWNSAHFFLIYALCQVWATLLGLWATLERKMVYAGQFKYYYGPIWFGFWEKMGL